MNKSYQFTQEPMLANIFPIFTTSFDKRKKILDTGIPYYALWLHFKAPQKHSERKFGLEETLGKVLKQHRQQSHKLAIQLYKHKTKQFSQNACFFDIKLLVICSEISHTQIPHHAATSQMNFVKIQITGFRKTRDNKEGNLRTDSSNKSQ